MVYGNSAALMGGSLLIEDARDPITIQDLQRLNRRNIFGFAKGISYNFSDNESALSDHIRSKPC